MTALVLCTDALAYASKAPGPVGACKGEADQSSTLPDNEARNGRRARLTVVQRMDYSPEMEALRDMSKASVKNLQPARLLSPGLRIWMPCGLFALLPQ